MAGGIFSKMREVMGIDAEEYDDDDLDIEEEAEPVSKPEPPVQTAQPYRRENRNFGLESRERGRNVVNMQEVSTVNKSQKQRFKLVVTEPKNLNDCEQLVDNLRSRKPVLINVTQLDRVMAQRICDFLSGATCTLRGSCQGIIDGIFLYAPENVVVEEIRDQADEAVGRETISRPVWNTNK